MQYGKQERLLDSIGFAILLFPFMYLIVQLFSLGVPDLPNGGDGALLEMSTRDVFSRQILLGPYSRFLFFHPGPLYFILRYPVYMLLGQKSSSFLITTILILTGSLFGIWKTVRKHAGSASGFLVTLFFGLFFIIMDKTLWLSEWNPHVIMFPILLFIVSCAAFAAGHSRYFFLCVLAGSLVAQTHLGGIPLLGAIFVLAVVFLVYPWFIGLQQPLSTRFKWKHILLGSGLLLLLWLPPLYEQFSTEKGNLSKIQEFFEENDPEISIVEGFRYWSNTVSRFEVEHFMSFLRNSGIIEDLSLVIVALRILLLSVSYGLLRRRGGSPFLCGLCMLLIVSHAVTFYSVTQIRGPVNDYLIEWMSAIAPLSYVAVLITPVNMAKDRMSESVMLYCLYGIVLIVAALGFFITRDVSGYLRSEIPPSCTDELAIEAMSRELRVLMDEDPDSYYILNLQTWNCWIVMTGIMNRLEKQGCNIVMSENVWFKETPVPDGHSSRILHIGSLNENTVTLPDLVARYDRFGILLQ